MERQPEVLVEVAARLLEVGVRQALLVRPAGCGHYVVDRCRHLVEEPLERSRSVASKAALGQCGELERRVPEADR